MKKLFFFTHIKIRKQIFTQFFFLEICLPSCVCGTGRAWESVVFSGSRESESDAKTADSQALISIIIWNNKF